MSPASMSAAVLSLLVLVALLLPVAPFAISHGARQLHARRHAACLHRIAQLEYDLGMYPSATSMPGTMTSAQFAERMLAAHNALARISHQHHVNPARPQADVLSAEREKVWAENRKRTVQEIRDRYYREGH